MTIYKKKQSSFYTMDFVPPILFKTNKDDDIAEEQLLIMALEPFLRSASMSEI
jgi:hypothetical protein